MNPEKLFQALGEPFAAGYFHAENAPAQSRHADAICAYLASAPPPPCEPGAQLYPSGACNLWRLLPEQQVSFDYCWSMHVNVAALQEKAAAKFPSGFAAAVFNRCVGELVFVRQSVIPPRYAIGGRGFMHSILNYPRLLQEGLLAYRERLQASVSRKSAGESGGAASGSDFAAILLRVLDAIIAYHGRCLDYLRSENADPELIAAFERVPLRPARTFHEAVLAMNVMFYLDGCDSAGRLDACFTPYEATATAPERQELLSALWRNFDLNNAWHVLLDSRLQLAREAIQAQRPWRRPNAGILIDASTPPAAWEAIFDSWQAGNPNPSLYARDNYNAHIGRMLGVAEADITDYAFGGCTELMVQGKSKIASIDAGINLLEVLAALLNERSYDDFNALWNALEQAIRHHVAVIAKAVLANHDFMATHRPQLIRSLFIDDCIDRGVEYNAGGARYCGGVINVVGLTNVINALHALRCAYQGQLEVTVPELQAALDKDFDGHDDILLRLRQLPKFGNGDDEVDGIAARLSAMLFQEIISYSRPDFYFLPSVILFVTSVPLGTYVPATADGRRAGAPLADSVGAAAGTDRQGPTALLRSVAAIDHRNALGTTILNLRLQRAMLADSAARKRLQALVLGYFQMGGLQLQATVVDPETLKAAVADPASHGHVMIRVGGYSEYFTRLSPSLQQEVIRREEHVV
ncbi:MAG TPA: pyruvate formate lyase family protein [Lentisphaeria bacterium]|nr:pyruvate formate lyase family protein [Lentisphaeria bacterium]